MSNELSQLDQLIESDVLAALGQEPSIENTASEELVDEELTNIPEELQEEQEEIVDINNDLQSVEDTLDSEDEIDIGDIEILPLAEIESAIEDQEDEVSISSNTLNELTNMISSLLKNKTIEITIKVKD